MKRKILFLVIILIAIFGTRYEAKATTYVDSSIDVRYRVAITTIGWQQNAYYDGDTAGLEGKAIPLEDLRAVIQSDDKNIGIRYMAYIKDKGWKNWAANGREIGTQEKKLTAVKLELTNTTEYVIQYRVYINEKGWEPWVTNGEISGLENGNFIEAIQIKILTKDLKEQNKVKVRYRVCLLSNGWQNEAYYNGETAGDKKGEIPLQSIRLVLENKPKDKMGIQYQTYIKNNGWQTIESNGTCKEIEGKPITAMKINLTNCSEKYLVKYRIKSKGKDWQSWVQDGKIAGTENGDEIIAIQVKIIEDKDYVEPQLQVRYRTHLLGKYWQNDAYYDGETGGIINSNTYLDSTRMVLQNAPDGGTIQYKTYIQNKGWQDWKENGHESNEYNSAMTGIKIKLINMNDYAVSYRVFLENKGWQSWVEDGKLAGTEGDNRIEGIQIKVIEKTELKKEQEENPLKVRYRIHSLNNGWSNDAFYDGQTGGKE